MNNTPRMNAAKNETEMGAVGCQLEKELAAARREKRAMFAAMSPSCKGRYPISGDCRWVHGQHNCSMGICPNLKGGKK